MVPVFSLSNFENINSAISPFVWKKVWKVSRVNLESLQRLARSLYVSSSIVISEGETKFRSDYILTAVSLSIGPHMYDFGLTVIIYSHASLFLRKIPFEYYNISTRINDSIFPYHSTSSL